MNSKFEYVRSFEAPVVLLPNSWVIVRIDGRGFHKFTKMHEFEKPNDKAALLLMNKAAKEVMLDLGGDILLAYGQSDEYSFLLHRESTLFKRRSDKIVTTIVSLFTANYIFYWNQFFPNKPMQYPATFDGRAVIYPTDKNVLDYLSWRQVDCHINNLYNTTFWGLVHSGMTEREAEQYLVGTFSKDKHEILFQKCNINYNNEDNMYKKGSILVRTSCKLPLSEDSTIEEKKERKRIKVDCVHDDMISSKSSFWSLYPYMIPYQSKKDQKKDKKRQQKRKLNQLNNNQTD